MPVVSEKVIKPPESFKGFDSEKGLWYNLNQLGNLIDPGNISGALSVFTTGGFKLPKAAEFTGEAVSKMAPQMKSYVWDFLKDFPVRVVKGKPPSTYAPSLREISLSRGEGLPHEWVHYMQDILKKPVGEYGQRILKASPRYLQDWVFPKYKKHLANIARTHGPKAAQQHFADEVTARLFSESTYKDYPKLINVLKRNPQLVEEIAGLEKFIQPEEAYGIYELLKGTPAYL